MMLAVSQTAQVLLISDDENAGKHYRGALEASGYDVVQTASFVDSLSTPMQAPDVIVLHDLAVLAYPGQTAPVVRIRDKMTPDEVVAEVHRRIGLGALLAAAGDPA
jgi:ActR/RegA family two-component response regulator